MTDVGVIRVWMVGAVLYVLSLILAGISNQYQSVWGFWLSVGVLSGFATGFTNLPAAVGIVKWFREVGRPGLGSGIAGFCFGMWPAIFSFYCPILIKNYGVTKSFYYNALIVTISSIPAMMFLADPSEVPLMAQPEDISSSSNDFVTQEQPEEGNRRENNTTLQSSQAYPMKLQEILTTKQFSIQFLAICFSLLPGFAMKFNISVFASAIFHADASTQAIISFIYLFSYSLIRLVVGLLAGSNPAFSSSHIASFSALIQVPGFIAAGLVVWFGSQYLWAFVVFQTVRCIFSFPHCRTLLLIVPFCFFLMFYCIVVIAYFVFISSAVHHTEIKNEIEDCGNGISGVQSNSIT
jgi:MFS family permease